MGVDLSRRARRCFEPRSGVHPGLRPICDSIRRLDAFRENRLSRAELLEEIDERAEALYGELWTSCGDTEKLELRHIAQFGLPTRGPAAPSGS